MRHLLPLLLLIAACDTSETLTREETCETVVTPYCEHAAECFTSLPVDWCVDQIRPLCERSVSKEVPVESVDRCLQAIESAECPPPSEDGSSRTVTMPEECEDM